MASLLLATAAVWGPRIRAYLSLPWPRAPQAGGGYLPLHPASSRTGPGCGAGTDGDGWAREAALDGGQPAREDGLVDRPPGSGQAMLHVFFTKYNSEGEL